MVYHARQMGCLLRAPIHFPTFEVACDNLIPHSPMQRKLWDLSPINLLLVTRATLLFGKFS